MYADGARISVSVATIELVATADGTALTWTEQGADCVIGAWRGVTGAIVGARSAAQVDGWIAAGQFDLSPADLDEIARAIAQSEAGEGPARPEQAGANAGD